MPVKKATIKKTATKEVAKPITKTVTKSVSKPVSKTAEKTSGLSVSVYSLAGSKTGTMILSKKIFGHAINKALLSQALRVYSTNQKTLLGSTKTRGEVVGSTAKIYRQKGTGRARHGAITAPIFVGGGITFGPKPRKVRLHLSQNMKKQALISALSTKAKDEKILGITGLEKATGKTKEMVSLLEKINIKSTLIVTGGKLDNVVRAARNIPRVMVLPVNQLNAYEVLKYQTLLISKDSVEALEK